MYFMEKLNRKRSEHFSDDKTAFLVNLFIFAEMRASYLDREMFPQRGLTAYEGLSKKTVLTGSFFVYPRKDFVLLGLVENCSYTVQILT